MDFKAFITGSRAYGIPRENSDLDLVICLDDPAQEAIIQSLSDRPDHATRYGRLNLIMLEPEQFETWRTVNDALIARRPVTRDDAIKALEAAGINEEPSGTAPSPVPEATPGEATDDDIPW